MTLTPEALQHAAGRGDVERTAALLRGAGEAERRACVPAVKALSAALRTSSRWGGRTEAAALARAGTYSGAAAVARDLRAHP